MIRSKWTEDAAKEGSKFLKVNRVNPKATANQSVMEGIVDLENWNIDKKAQYFYMCQNETIEGIEFDQKMTRKIFDRVKAENPDTIFVADQSSVLGARNMHIEDLYKDYGVIFSGAHKNLGTSGMTITLMREDVIDRVTANRKRAKIPVPKLFDWTEYAKGDVTDFVNTPTMMAVYITQATCEYFNAHGGIDFYEDKAIKMSQAIYN